LLRLLLIIFSTINRRGSVAQGGDGRATTPWNKAAPVRPWDSDPEQWGMLEDLREEDRDLLDKLLTARDAIGVQRIDVSIAKVRLPGGCSSAAHNFLRLPCCQSNAASLKHKVRD
jgi:hypothetical protein